MLVTNIFHGSDGHAQERTMLPEILETVQAQQVWIAERFTYSNVVAYHSNEYSRICSSFKAMGKLGKSQTVLFFSQTKEKIKTKTYL